MIRKIQDILVRAGSAAGSETSTRRPAFTLLEILIAVAALGLIAVGVASIFDATGKTLATGKRVSAFNAYASLIEQQLRADITSMTREGFLLIRNEYADRDGVDPVLLPSPGGTTGDVVPLYDGDESPRPRRIDELMFFAKGRFISARTAFDPRFVAESDAARIYFGHGQKARVPANFVAMGRYHQPELDGLLEGSGQEYDNTALLGRDDVNNPNRFASDWTLLRHVTLLSPNRYSQAEPPASLGYAQGDPLLLDSQIQIALQPAASDIFRRLTATFPITQPAAIRTGSRAFSSGLLDIATTDLARIRAVVCTAKYANTVDPQFYSGIDNLQPAEDQNPGVDGVYRLSTHDPNVVRNIQAWMNDALPSNSMATADRRVRMRCESSPRNFLGSLNNTLPEAERAYRPADQVMLSASNFLPRCTEFIVEWSFGDTRSSNPNSRVGYIPGEDGQFIWHGLERWVAGKKVCGPYDTSIAGEAVMMQYPLKNGGSNAKMVGSDLIHGADFATTAPTPRGPLTSYFGYYDPGFNPAGVSVNPTIPWAWPKLIRVTLSLADPADPTIERTFQFVFDIPEGN